MGCFDATCAVTNLPIHFGDPIVYIEIGDTTYFSSTTRGVLEVLYPIVHMQSKKEIDRRIGRRKRWSNYESVTDEEIKKSVIKSIREEAEHLQENIIIYHGYYNDYGGVAKEKNSFDAEYPSQEKRITDNYFFIHQAVWDAFDGNDEYHKLYKILQTANDARIEITFGWSMLGQQYSGIEFIEARKKFQEIEEKLLPHLFCSNEEYNDESQNC